MKCPICKKELSPGAPGSPFCGERCRLIDLGKWADEEYRIPAATPASQPEPQPEHDEEDENG